MKALSLFFAVFFLCAGGPTLWGKETVPAEMTYCGLKLKFTEKGREALQKELDRINANVLTKKTLVKRANMYMPFVTDAFLQIGAPEDLKYIVIQESGLRGGAVSRSNAVGFWQFKDFTAKEVGLSVDAKIDERKHIFRASIGAARYFITNYRRHRNWVYSVISYNTGGTGALPFIDDQYRGADEMVIDENLHWYARKAIAHKLAYEDEIQPGGSGEEWLAPVSTNGETDVHKLIAGTELSEEEFKAYNLWINGTELPEGAAYSIYVLQKNKPYAHVRDPFLFHYAPELEPERPMLASDQTKANLENVKAANAATRQEQKTEPEAQQSFLAALFGSDKDKSNNGIDEPGPVEQQLEEHPYYGKEFVAITSTYTLVDVAQEYDLPLRRLKRWNDVDYEMPPPGSIVLIKNPRRAHVHIAKEMETMEDVAARYRKKTDKLLRLNRMTTASQLLKRGELVYLRAKKPKNEPTMIYHAPGTLDEAANAQAYDLGLSSEPVATVKADAPARRKNSPHIYQPGDRESAANNKPQTIREQTPEPEPTPKQPEPKPKPSEPEKLLSAEKPAITAPPRPKNRNAHLFSPGDKGSSDAPVKRARVHNDYQPADYQTEKYKIHVVQPGETVWGICRQHSLTPDELRNANGMTNNELQAGDSLKIPRK